MRPRPTLRRVLLAGCLAVGSWAAVPSAFSADGTSPRSAAAVATYSSGVGLRGINRAGMEYGDGWDGWTGQTYFNQPSSSQITAELSYYQSRGFNLIRLPISWERIQHTLNGPLDSTHSAGMMRYINAATAAGFTVLLDVHNYNRYATGAYNASGVQVSTYTHHVMGDGTLTAANLQDLWVKLVGLVKTNARVVLNLMNESHDFPMTSTQWFAAIQQIMNAIRAAGSNQLILVPNSRSSDVGHWSTWASNGGPVDSQAALALTGTNFAYDMHSYYPESYGGQDTSTYANQLKEVTTWAKTNGKKLFLSELGVETSRTTGSSEISSALTYLNANADVWLGWSPWDLAPYQLTSDTHTADAVTNTGVKPISWFAPFLTPGAAPGTTDVYRFWSEKFNNAHFYTASKTESDHIRATDPNWIFEGTAFRAVPLASGSCTSPTTAVYRFYSSKFQSHFYTATKAESDHIRATEPNWTYEGPTYCAYPSPVAGTTTALYRFWNPVFGKHFFTASKTESDHIQANDRTWTYEGIAYDVLP